MGSKKFKMPEFDIVKIYHDKIEKKKPKETDAFIKLSKTFEVPSTLVFPPPLQFEEPTDDLLNPPTTSPNKVFKAEFQSELKMDPKEEEEFYGCGEDSQSLEGGYLLNQTFFELEAVGEADETDLLLHPSPTKDSKQAQPSPPTNELKLADSLLDVEGVNSDPIYQELTLDLIHSTNKEKNSFDLDDEPKESNYSKVKKYPKINDTLFMTMDFTKGNKNKPFAVYYRKRNYQYLNQLISEDQKREAMDSGALDQQTFELHQIRLLSQSSYHQNWLYLDKNTNTHYCVKAFGKKHNKNPLYRYFVEKQIKFHLHLKHPNLISCFGSFEDRVNKYLVLEFCEGYSFDQALSIRLRFDEYEIRFFLAQIVKGLTFLHSKDLLFRNLSITNLLITKDLVVKFNDFSLANFLLPGQTKRQENVGAYNHFAPEQRDKDFTHTKLCDSWALGFLTFQFTYGYDPRVNLTDDTQPTIDFPHTDLVDPNLFDLMQQLLQVDPQLRLPADQVLLHPFFTAPNDDPPSTWWTFENLVFFKDAQTVKWSHKLKESIKSREMKLANPKKDQHDEDDDESKKLMAKYHTGYFKKLFEDHEYDSGFIPK